MTIGRPTILTPELQATLCVELELGCPVSMACDTAMLSETTYHRWRARGEAEESGIYRDFWEATSRARNKGRRALYGTVRKAAVEDPKCAMWLLDRGHREHFARQVEVTGKDSGPLEVVTFDPSRLACMSDDELVVLRAALAKM